jgi:serine/threonine-protein kinase HipA
MTICAIMAFSTILQAAGGLHRHTISIQSPSTSSRAFLTTAIDEADGTASLDLAFAVAEHFGLKPDNARKIASEIGNAVKNWRQTAKTLGLSADQISRMASAFEHKELEQAMSGPD